MNLLCVLEGKVYSMRAYWHEQDEALALPLPLEMSKSVFLAANVV